MQILLIQPWIEDFYRTDCRSQPIGLAYLAASVKQHFPQADVTILDAMASKHKKTITWPHEFKYLKPYYNASDSGPFALFRHYYRFGYDDQSILSMLARQHPFLIGISSLFTPYYRQSLEMARLCRSVFPHTPIVMGGHHATMSPLTLLKPKAPFSAERLCDFVLRGEAESSLCELITALLQNRPLTNVPNLIRSDQVIPLQISNYQQECTFHEDLPDVIPQPRDDDILPDFCDLKMHDYQYERHPMAFLITSRSCPHRCDFCSIHAVFGTHHWIRQTNNVVHEIVQRYAEGVRHFDIEDDNFTFNKSACLALLQNIQKLKLPITFSAMNGLSYLSLDREIMEQMLRTGFRCLNLSLVSADRALLKSANRPHRLTKLNSVIEIATTLGFTVTVYFIIGMPGQQLAEMWNTFKQLATSQCLMGPSPFYFTPGSPMHRKHRQAFSQHLASNGQDPYLSARLTTLDLESTDFCRDDIYTLFRLTRIFNWIKQQLDNSNATTAINIDAAMAILTNATWPRSSANSNSLPAPFSPRIKSLLRGTTLHVQGYKSRNEITIVL